LPPVIREGEVVAERKPAGVPWESWVDRQIREAQERGDFDNLAGAGKPLADLDRPRDELWWVRRKLADEQLSYLPPALQLRKDVETAREQIGHARSEQEVRRIVAEINEVIRAVNRGTTEGLAPTVALLDEERVVAQWREQREAGA
jgi:hypothetical protein